MAAIGIRLHVARVEHGSTLTARQRRRQPLPNRGDRLECV
jgi:hypothetical protein